MTHAPTAPTAPAVPGGRGRRASLVSATGWSAVGVALAGLTRFAYSAVVVRLEGASVLAAVNSAIALALLVGLLGPTPLGNAAAKFVARRLGAGDDDGAARQWRSLLGGGLLLSAGCALAGAVAAVGVLGRSGDDALAVASVVVGLALYTLARGGRFALGGYARAAAGEAAAAVVALGLLAAVLVVSGGTVPTGLVVLPLAVGYVVYAVVVWPSWRRHPGPADSAAGPAADPAAGEGGEVPRFVAWGVLGGVASAGLLQLSMVVAATVDTPGRAGLYAAAIAVGTPVALLAVPLSQALFATLAHAGGSGDHAAVRARTDAATRALVLLVVAVAGGLVLVPRTALATVGPGLAAAVPLMQVVALAVLVSSLTVPATASLTSGAGSGMRLVALLSGAGLLTGCVVMAVATARGAGVGGVAAGYAAGTVLTNTLLWWSAWRRHRLPWAGLTVTVLGALAVLVGLVVLRAAVPALGSVAAEWATGVAFSVLWLAVNARQARRLLRAAAPGRRAPSAG